MATCAGSTGPDERLDEAIDELRRERRRTADELEALRGFEDRVRSIDSEQNAVRSQPLAGVATANTTTGLRQVRDAYESTLMSVPHYIEEYDDTYAESLAEEFSPDIASALTDGTEFNGRCKRAVLSAVSTSQSARKSLLGVIDRERESILAARDDLVPLVEELGELDAVPFDDETFGALDAYRARLQVMRKRCEELSDRRQGSIFDQRRIQRLPSNVPDVTMYFYQGIGVEYPVISIVAELLDRIETLRERVERAMAFCRG
ncbi:MAG: DUF7260 family protein [Halobacteriota archaeon]|uniref:DUF7260 family protein n=1 Tax=Natronomonas sp. TaxID=2184060 RepID=UPI003975F6AE